MRNFPAILKELRHSRGLTQEKLAASLGVAKSTISMYEVGERTPDFETEEAIADFFNVDLNFLRGYDEKRNAAASGDWTIELPPVHSEAYNSVCEHLMNLASLFGRKEVYVELKRSNPTHDRLKEIAQLCRIDADAFSSLVKNCIDISIATSPKEKKDPLTGESQQGELMSALEAIGAISDDGRLSDKGRSVITDLLRNNADLLKKVINEGD